MRLPCRHWRTQWRYDRAMRLALQLAAIALQLAAIGCIAILVPAPATADSTDLKAVRDGIRKNLRYRRVGQRVTRLGAVLRGPGPVIERTNAATTLGNMRDRRVVDHLLTSVGDPHPLVGAVCLHALTWVSPADLRAGGGAALVLALADELASNVRHRQRLALGLLRKIADAESTGASGDWKVWAQDHAALLKRVPSVPPFDTSGHNPELVARVERELGAEPTVATPGKREGPRNDPGEASIDGYRAPEVALLIDATESMAARWSRTTQSLRAFIRALYLFDAGARVGVMSYGDRVRRLGRLRTDAEKTLGALQAIRVRGGGDSTEGVARVLHEAARGRSMRWSKEAAKNMVLVCDAPPHRSQVGRAHAAISKFRALGHARVHVMRLGPIAYQTLSDIARRGGGQLAVPHELHLLLQTVLSSVVPRSGVGATEDLARALIAIARLDDA